MTRGLKLSIDRLVDRDVTRCTVDIPAKLQCEIGPPPTEAWLADNSVLLVEENSPESDAVVGDLGYWQLDREGLAMMFLRLAWYAAHAELGAGRFDGDARRSWERDEP